MTQFEWPICIVFEAKAQAGGGGAPEGGAAPAARPASSAEGLVPEKGNIVLGRVMMINKPSVRCV